MCDKKASLTTVSTPHHCSKTMDVLLKFPSPLLRFGCKITDIIMKIGGDQNPKTYEVIRSFSTESAAEFNSSVSDDSRVYYQSYSFVMKHWYSDIFMALPYAVVYALEGQSDGLVVPDSAKWGEHKGVYSGNSHRGISHCDEVDMRRFRLTRKSGDQISDRALFYVKIAKELGERGF